MLNSPTKYKQYFKAMGLVKGDEGSAGGAKGFDMDKIKRLKQMMSHVILLHPLVNTHSTLKNLFGPFGRVVEMALTLGADYNAFNKTQYELLKEMYSADSNSLPPLTIFLSPRDEVVGTVHNGDLKIPCGT